MVRDVGVVGAAAGVGGWGAGGRGWVCGGGGEVPLGGFGVEVYEEPFIVVVVPDGFPAFGDFGRWRA